MKYWGISKLLPYMPPADVVSLFDWVKNYCRDDFDATSIVRAADIIVPLAAPSIGYNKDGNGAPCLILTRNPNRHEWEALERVSLMQDTDGVIAIIVSPVH